MALFRHFSFPEALRQQIAGMFLTIDPQIVNET